MSEPTPTAPSARTLLTRGIAWNSVFQIFQAVVSFGAMLLLVRVIPPAEYGRVSVILSFLLLLNTVNCGVFIRQALQLPDGATPDWNLHWSAGFFIQGALSLLCHAIAGLFWFLPHYRPVAALMHVAAIGVFLDWPNQFAIVMLRRDMNFRRIRIVQGIGFCISTAVMIVLGLAGKGAWAIVIGNNVILGLPFALDLFFVRSWRPVAGWWHKRWWKDYRAAFHFGSQQVAAGSLQFLRGAAEAAILPGAVGLVAMGLWNRAQALFSSTVGRVQGIVTETVYPLLPRYAGDRDAYRRNATLFAQVIVWIVVPSAVYLGVGGPELSRLIYGKKWIEADPLIWPGALAGLGMSLYVVGATILLAANKLRACFLLDVVNAAACVPTVLLVLLGARLVTYAWILGMAQVLVGLGALIVAARFMAQTWVRSVLIAPLSVCSVAAVAVWYLAVLPVPASLPLRVLLHASTYVILSAMGLRVLFARELAATLDRVPGAWRLRPFFMLKNPQPVAVSMGVS